MSAAQVFRLPDLGEGLTEAEIVQWLVAEGETVVVDQPVVTVETAKALVDVPCPYGGTVLRLHGEPGQLLAVGEPLVSVGVADAARTEGDEPVPAGPEQYRTEERAGGQPPSDDAPERPLIGYGAAAEAPRQARRRRAAMASGPERTAPTATPAAGAVRVISPLVRRLAHDTGVDLTTVTATGPGGVIRRVDVEAAATAATAPSPDRTRRRLDVAATGRAGGGGSGPTGRAGGGGSTAGDTRVPISGVHRLMVDRLTTSRREIPDATTWVDVDATGLMEVRDALRSARPDAGIGVLALLARIVVAGLQRHPELNASVDTAAGEIVRHGAIHLGIAAQSPRGLVVPVVHDAQALSTTELAAALRDLTTRAREGRLTPAELGGGTATLNNYGVYGVDGSTPILNHPEAVMLGVGRIVDKPWVVDGALAVRKVTQLSFTFDHRVCDGATAGGFLRDVADCVERPAVLLADV